MLLSPSRMATTLESREGDIGKSLISTLRRMNLEVRELDLRLAPFAQCVNAEADLAGVQAVIAQIPHDLIVDLEDEIGADGADGEAVGLAGQDGWGIVVHQGVDAGVVHQHHPEAPVTLDPKKAVIVLHATEHQTVGIAVVVLASHELNVHTRIEIREL